MKDAPHLPGPFQPTEKDASPSATAAVDRSGHSSTDLLGPPQATVNLRGPRRLASPIETNPVAERDPGPTHIFAVPAEQRSSSAAQDVLPLRLPLPAAVPTGYEILAELGRGGMGVVYKARDTRLHRLVALKMMLHASPAALEERIRFRVEAEAVAQVQHPNIVQIHEVAEHDGCPYLVLEYLEGGTLAQTLTGTPRPPIEAARLIDALARAIHFAHLRGIVHRDLKPANVLLAADGTPRITDFGIAKRLDSQSEPQVVACQTQTGNILGTPSYMAPEQGDGRPGRVGPAADVYSLGAILYELLTGRPPFHAASPIETLLLVRAEVPVAPRRLASGVPHDLQTICLKCLEKEPGRRYASAQDLADDLQRFVDGRPIQARPVGTLERGWKWARRRPAAAALVLVSVLALFSLFGTVAWYSVQLQQERDEAERQKDDAIAAHQQARQAFCVAEQQRQEALDQRREAEKQRREADTQRKQAQQQGDQAKHERDKARDWFGQACAAVDVMLSTVGQERLSNIPQMETVRRQLLEEALSFYQGFMKEKSHDPLIRKQTARALWRVADIQLLLGNVDRAEQVYQRALGLQWQVVLQSHSAPEARCDLGNIHNNLGMLYCGLGQRHRAEHHYGEALKLHEVLLHEFPKDRSYRKGVAQDSNNLGVLLKEHGGQSEAQKPFERSLELRQGLYAEFPNDPQTAEDLAFVQTNRGLMLAGLRRFQDAEKAYRQACELLQPLVDHDPTRSKARCDLARNCNNFSMFLDQQGKEAEAQQTARQAVSLWQKLVQDFPGIAPYRVGLASAWTTLGLVLDQQSNPETEVAYRQAVELRRKLTADTPRSPDYQSDLGGALHNLAAWLAQHARVDEACRMLDQAIIHQSAAFDVNPARQQYRQFLRNHYVLLSSYLVVRKDHARAADMAGRHPPLYPTSWYESYQAAKTLANCVTLASNDAQLTDQQKKQRAEKYGADAVALLRSSLKHGLGRAVNLGKAPALDPLRARPDFQELLRQAYQASAPRQASIYRLALAGGSER